MHIARLGTTNVAGLAAMVTLFQACCLVAGGCAHHRADQYAFAPPYAPPVYSQPHVQMPAQPTVYAAAPGGGMPSALATASAMPPGAFVPDPTMAESGVVSATGGECPPCSTPDGERMVMPATMIEGGGQTPPCPPGP